MDIVVVGFEDTDRGARALARAADVAGAFGASLIVLSVTSAPLTTVAAPVLEPVEAPFIPAAVGPVPTPEARPHGLIQGHRWEALANRQLDGARTYLAERNVQVEYVAEVGDPAATLLALAEERDADLIVVGCGGHGLLARMLGRGVGETVGLRAERDVLLVV